MKKQKFVIDYIIKSSPTILYDFITSPPGLSQWFADSVEETETELHFWWNGYKEIAQILEDEHLSHIKFKMEDRLDEEYTELRISKSEVTDDTILIITDFAEPDEIDDQKRLWNRQIDILKMKIGGGN